MANEVIRSFLVALGFKTDEDSLKKFEVGINRASKAVFAFAAAIEGTAVAVAAGVARFASNLEALYFAAQRTSSSAIQLKALDQAAQNLGANAGEAIEGVEGLAAALRTNPGNVGLLTGLLAKLGLTLKYNADGSIDAADSLLKLSQVLKSMPYFQANSFAGQLGLSEHLLYQLTHGNLLEEYNNQIKQMGPNWNKTVEDAHKFMVELRNLEIVFQSFGLIVLDALQNKLGISLDSVRKWMEKNGPWLAGRIVDVSLSIVHAAEQIAKFISIVIDKFKEWDSSTDGLSTKLIALAVVFKVTGAGSLIGGIFSLARAFGRLAAAMIEVNTAASGAGLIRLLGPVGLGVAAGWALDKYFPDNWLAQAGNKVGGDVYEAFHPYGDKLGLQLNNPGNLGFHNQANAIPGGPGGRFANFTSPGEGLFAMARQLGLYGSRGINNIRDIVSLWAPRSENDTSAYIADVARRTGYRSGDSLNLQDPAVLANLQNAMIFHEQGKNPYQPSLVSDKAREAIDYVRGTQLSQQTTIHVDGSGTPEAVADRVTAEQRRVNQELTRDLALILVQ